MKRLALTTMTMACFLACSGSDRNKAAGTPDPGIQDGGDDDDGDDDDDDDGTEKLDLGDTPSGDDDDGDADGEDKTNKVDILFIIDNSGSTGQEQMNLAHNFPLLVQQLQGLTDSDEQPVSLDVQIMVTTTDMEHSMCERTQGVTMGNPQSTSCTTRLDHFTYNGDERAACTDNCPNPIVPEDSFLAFHGSKDNVPDRPDADVNGDGVPRRIAS